MSLKDILHEGQFNKIEKDCDLVQPNDLYFCLTSDEKTAENRAKIASQRGAKMIVSGFDLKCEKNIQVKEPRVEFAKTCAEFYGNPAKDLTMIGVTGTNGKTTTTHIISQILKSNGKKVGLIGTNGVFYSGQKFDCPLTTPDADFLHKTFREMKDSGVEVVVMEVSAHAIEQKRTYGIVFDVGVLTNITQDHLDYFKNFENYEKVKLDFFNSDNVRRAVICSDDKSARKLVDGSSIPITTYGLYNPSDVFALDTFCSMEGSHFVANLHDHVMEIKTNLVGEYNILNCLAAMSVCEQLGLDAQQIARGLCYVMPAEGRFNVVNLNGKYVVIDFAHSPDSLKNVLQTARALTDKKVRVVFGCGGNRDKDKRHKMGSIAEKYADEVYLTNDNPRLEDPESIICDIEEGMTKKHCVQLDRQKAIKQAIEEAQAGDIILVAGKGAEKYQEIGTERKPYNDFDAVYNIFKEKDPNRFKGKGW